MTNEERFAKLAEANRAAGLSLVDVGHFIAKMHPVMRPVALICNQCCTSSPEDAQYCIGCGQRFGSVAVTGKTTRL